MSLSLRSSDLAPSLNQTGDHGAVQLRFLLLSELQEVLQCQVDPPLRLLHLPDVLVQVDGGGLGGGAGAGGETGEVLRDVIVGHGGPLVVIRLRSTLDQEDIVSVRLDY